MDQSKSQQMNRLNNKKKNLKNYKRQLKIQNKFLTYFYRPYNF